MMLQKLRRAMVNPERTPLTEAVEVDECFVGGLDRELRGGRQHGTKALVVVAVEVRGAGSGRLRMQVVENASTAALTGFVQDVVEPGAVVHTDGWNSYRRLSKLDYDHRPRTQRPGRVAADDLDDILPRVHRAISNLKTWLQGTHHGVSKEHLQVYLDEYTFRFNRRRTPMAAFQTLLGLSGQQPPTTYRQIYAQGPGGRPPMLDPSIP
jgi:transposase-like protein